ncbi:alpha/beta hydrolase [Mucilaginibacter sabulilitoris]|uniref:Alpha/beta hydrolase n=1 Tax=Mucilaginibacter sabulilitoris TaxID=1173583 RepID=A0ABZ0TX92_9SPHI|nr:alpha/beta hydrolase [Mucilaginibacter sabulilitoris]WPU96409.1 alpha/beta hydrolase [Mucilaginibacter sabulilitoris]
MKILSILLSLIVFNLHLIKFDKIMKRKITFKRDELTLTGDLFTPENFDKKGQYKAIIVEGSLTSVKEQMPETYAKKFANEGFVVLAFDYSHYGESDGKPRQLEAPDDKLKDLQAAVSYLTSLSYVKSVGMVGVCTSAGNAAYLASSDPRIKAMATVAGYLPDPSLLESLSGKEKIASRREAAAIAKSKFEKTGEETIMTAYSETDKSAANFNPTEGFYDYYLNKTRGGVSQWKNELAVMSWETFQDFDPISKASAITVPTMVVHSDGCAFPSQARKFYSQLQGEKELVWADGNHFDYYDQPAQVNNAVKSISRFFKKHLW